MTLTHKHLSGMVALAKAAHAAGLESPFKAASVNKALCDGKAAIARLESHKAAHELRLLVIRIDIALNELTGEGIEAYANAAKEAKE